MSGLLSCTAGVLQVIVAERGALVFVFNLSPFHSFEGYKVSRKASCSWQHTLVLHDLKAETRTCSCIPEEAAAGAHVVSGSGPCLHES